VVDEGRGIPVGPHPCYPGKDILEIRLTKVHAC
jgi:DNA gyrase subunit B